MTYPRQTCFWRAFARLTCVVVALGIIVCASMLDPAQAGPWLRTASDALWRIWVYAMSIMLEAAPFVLTGSAVAAFMQRFANGSIAAPLFAALAPGCDCAMNGFAVSLRRCAPQVAGMSLVWGAACNPIALLATGMILGRRVLVARIVGGVVAAALVGLWWRERAHRACDHPQARAPALAIASHLEDGVRLLLPAAFAGAAALVLLPNAARMHASPIIAALAAALLSPCSTADPVLAKVIAGSTAGEAAFVVAAQCADVRLFLLLNRHFGVRRAAIAALAGAAGCIAAVLVAR